jgi:hypothetical protein
MMKRIIISTGLVLLILLNVSLAGAQSNAPQVNKMSIFHRFLEDNRVVIDDAVHRLTEGARYFDQYLRTPLQPSNFKEGQRVGFMRNENGEIEMMWKAE